MTAIDITAALYTVSKKDTDAAHYSFNADQPMFVVLTTMLLRKYAIKWSFVIPPLLTNVSALPGET